VIAVRRTSPPRVLAQNSARWLAALQTVLANPAATPRSVSTARDRYHHPAVKNALVRMFHGKCAYCESKITVVTYGAIEHFRPKGNAQYLHLTFDWNNLLLSCDVCNDARHKGARFPLDEHGAALLLDPTDGMTDPAMHLDFSWDPVANLAGVYGRSARGNAVEQIFDLNGQHGRKELLMHRSRYMRHLATLLRLAQDTHDQAAMALLEEACRADAPYSACARALVCGALRVLTQANSRT